MKKSLALFLALAMLLCGTGVLPGMGITASADGPDQYSGELILLFSNDIHSNLGNSKIMNADNTTAVIGGVARMAAAMELERAKAVGKYLTLDGGDYSQGTPYQDGYQKGWEILALAAMGVSYTTLGNHEFDVGDKAIENSWVNAEANRAKYGVDEELPQLVISNMFIKYAEDGSVIEYTDADIDPANIGTNAFGAGEYAATGAVNYAITEVNGIKIGMFGLEGANSYGYCKNSDLTRIECINTANVYSKYLKEVENCDLVIAISHCGDSEDLATAAASEGYLDIIQSAHDHTRYQEPVVENGVIIFSTGCYAQNLGVLSVSRTDAGWVYNPDETYAYALTEEYDYTDENDTSAAAMAYRKLSALVAQYDEELVAADGYFSKLGLDGVNSSTVVMNIVNGYDYIMPNGGYTYVQSPVTAFIGDAFNYASGSDVSFFFGGYVRTPLYTGEFTVADAFNLQSTGESAIDHSAGSSLIKCDLSGLQLAGICLFDAMCSGVASDGSLYGGAGTLHSSGMRYVYSVADGKISCDVSTIEIYNSDSGEWEPLDFAKAYSCSFTFESSQNLVSYIPMLTGMLGSSVPFAPYDEASGTYAEIPADNTSAEYYEFWAPMAKDQGILEGTGLELKSWTALYYYAASMGGTLSDYYTMENLVPTRIAAD